MLNPLDAIKEVQIAHAAEAGAKHPYETGFVLDDEAVAVVDPFNALNLIKAVQVELIASGGADVYSGAPAMTAVVEPKGLAHYQAALDADLASLAVLKTLEEKSKAKLAMLETYAGFVADYVNAGEVYPNSIAVRVMIWLFDVLNIEQGLTLAFVLIKQGVHVTPAKFDRDIPTFVCDAVYDWANALLKIEPVQSASPYLDSLLAVLVKDKWDLAPPVKSKMFAIFAKHKKAVGDWGAVLAACDSAIECNPTGAGVKTLRAEAVSALAKLSEPASAVELAVGKAADLIAALKVQTGSV